MYIYKLYIYISLLETTLYSNSKHRDVLYTYALIIPTNLMFLVFLGSFSVTTGSAKTLRDTLHAEE